MEIFKSNIIVDIAKTASLLSKQLLDLNCYIKNNPDKLKLFNYATPLSSGYNSTKSSNEHLNISNEAADEAYYSSKKDMTSLSYSSYSLNSVDSTKISSNNSLNMSCASSSNSSLLNSSVNQSNQKHINKRLFTDLDSIGDKENYLTNKFSTPQNLQQKIEPKLPPRIKETRKEKLKFRLKLMKQFAKHRSHLKSFIKSEKSKEETQKLTASTPFKIR